MSEKQISDEFLEAFPTPEVDNRLSYLQLLRWHQDKEWSIDTIAGFIQGTYEESVDFETVKNIVDDGLDRAEKIGREVLERQQELKFERIKEETPDKHIVDSSELTYDKIIRDYENYIDGREDERIFEDMYESALESSDSTYYNPNSREEVEIRCFRVYQEESGAFVAAHPELPVESTGHTIDDAVEAAGLSLCMHIHAQTEH